MQTIIFPVVHLSEGRPYNNVLFENGVGQWRKVETQGKLMRQGFKYIWSNLDVVEHICRSFGADCSINRQHISCSLTATPDRIVEFRSALQNIQAPTKCVLTADASYLFTSGTQINMEVAKQLTKLGTTYNTFISITGSDAGSYHINIIGHKENVEFTKIKCRALLEYFQGSVVERVEIPLSTQNLVFGPCKMHLLNIFQQTAVNVYAPPSLYAGRVPGANWDQVYLVGDAIQVAVAKTMLEEIKTKTEILMKTCVIALPTLVILYNHFESEISEITAINATFIQWPSDSNTVRILGTNRRSIESTIHSLMRLCTQIYTIIISSSNTPRAALLNLAKTGVVVTASKAEIVLSATTLQAHEVTKTLCQLPKCNSIAYCLELDSQLRDFLAGKKNGKILKVMNNSNSKIWFEPYHEYNLRVMLLCSSPSIAAVALPMLEDEMPAEEEIFIAEPYHKQIIGAGGQRIQSLMRRYNVYIKFEAIADKVPNAFANLQLDNVLLRCPKKHSKNIGPAIQDLQRNVAQCASEHRTTFLKLSRNHRRLLIGGQGNLIRDVEKWSNAVVKYPKIESRNTELLEIAGLGQSSINAAKSLQEHLPYDYEFRVAMNTSFCKIIGPGSDFAVRVTAPLRAAFNAQVQAFERVQVEGDSTIYSQIMISIPEEDEFIINEIDAVVTTFLRDHNLDIIEKGPLSTNLIVDGTAAISQNDQGLKQSTNPVGSENMTPLKQKTVTFNFNRTPMTPTPRITNQLMGAPPSLNWRNRDLP